MSFICDFCSDEKELVYLDVNTFEVRHVPDTRLKMMSNEGWWCCPVCLVFVQKGDKDGLFERSKSAFIKKNPGAWDDRIDPYLRGYQDQFWENRKEK